VTLFGGSGAADLDFDLETTGGELFTVKTGNCIVLKVDDAGAPDTYGPSGAPKMALTGQMDCDTGKFVGEVRGYYSSVSICDLGMEKQNYFFKGPVNATFDPSTRSFINGTIVLREPEVLIPLGGEAGGQGTWSATLNPDARAKSDAGPCLEGVRFPEELFPESGDAGT
jgi:hypothetical protein